ncbi:uncharacterized protein LOC133175371 isoform X2 [Saccostrea echinata]|uniref:uncharacterized protein LOC133175371 isoform X2 n=1 Tax=Saccostrea echinata TaxID=191078 RepID=UPI002A80DA79|nr:uncharacterized protein LOC133175371 isoform X2 [Saccostrea echinata]
MFIYHIFGCAVGISTGELLSSDNSCYQIITESLSRQVASERCITGGGHLGVIRQNVTLTAIGNRIKQQSESGILSSTVFWLGMNVTRGRILTENGQEVLLSSNIVQSTTDFPRGSCILISISSGEPVLISADCSRAFWMYGFICQYALSSQSALSSGSTSGLSLITLALLVTRYLL